MPSRCAATLAVLWLTGCNRHQSALAPFGLEAREVAGVTWVLLVGAVVIYVAVMALGVFAMRARSDALSHRQGMRLVLWVGAIVPTIVLAALLAWSLPLMRPEPVARGAMRVAVGGEQFWFRVRYPGGIESANVLRLPVGRTVALDLTASDVIHSFWVPGLAGKMDMIPGRTNRLVVRAEKAGRYRGVCAEFCGLSHALMAFEVVAMEPAAFDAWLAAEARPAVVATGRGAALFDAHGCGGCHAIRGTTARGTIGPDLTHMGARATIGAATLPTTTPNVARFIRAASTVKPGARMPAYPHLSDAETAALARYLVSLK